MGVCVARRGVEGRIPREQEVGNDVEGKMNVVGDRERDSLHAV